MSLDAVASEQDRSIVDTIARERRRLLGFIRRRVADPGDAEDILQDVFHELVEAVRLMKPIEQVGAWLFRVARNRITDRFRRVRSSPMAEPIEVADGADERLEDLLPAPDGGPESAYARGLLLEELSAALDELPDAQREVFVAHELEGRSFKELAAASGVGINTLLARKHYAVRHLRQRLQAIYDEFDAS